MPLNTAADILIEARAHFKSSDTVTAADQLHVTMDELCRSFPIATRRVSLALTSGTQEYITGVGAPWYLVGSATTANIASAIKIIDAAYLTSATSSRQLIATVPEELNAIDPNWRTRTAAAPTHVYTVGNAAGNFTIGFYPTPDASTTPSNGTGFPRVDLTFQLALGAGFTGTAPVPNNIPNPMVLVYGVAYRMAVKEGDDANIAKYRALYNAERNELIANIQTRDKRQRPSIMGVINAPRVR